MADASLLPKISSAETTRSLKSLVMELLQEVCGPAGLADVDALDFDQLQACLRGLPAERFWRRVCETEGLVVGSSLRCNFWQLGFLLTQQCAEVLRLKQDPDCLHSWWCRLKAVYTIVLA